ncbi:MAG: 6,7-dimethyl-8-ribityllumazine synthase [Chromatiales bacterium]|jgi:6,7-dimethyl-8-ribityllumazine synthase|nr:6,7-dimethyl-8-ribityllumazine synthase [Chromatiales bacterium]MDP6149605.1 6,7-dimethyl-8-ribityllumazine synthase [Gammaproteobacteria bacterium]MDP7092983.1 6,7-dimethyl-8-ribityllumazine synthase [Gammaproteobacteria bacterium]MDP7271079.1 6,7-dimethyl-8-ribityllumazine synthase [Gammaproteobacteria bacterium]HJP04417.1 6,7-dimethyl-8-ribityllumazine synthase [Gammaproteobacteria bacterium]
MNTTPSKSKPQEVKRNLYGASFCIVAARFNADIVELLTEAARQTLLDNGVADSAIEVIRVPGAFEIPLAARRAAQTKRFDGIVALAAIVRGGTPHFDYVSSASIGGINRVALDCDIPVGNGVLTVDTMEQAAERAGGPEGNKGADAALAAVEMVELLRDL